MKLPLSRNVAEPLASPLTFLPRRRGRAAAVRAAVLAGVAAASLAAGGRDSRAAPPVQPQARNLPHARSAFAQAGAPAMAPELHLAGLPSSAGRVSLHIQGLGSRPSGVLLVILPGADKEQQQPAPLSLRCKRLEAGSAAAWIEDELPAEEFSVAAYSLSAAAPATGSPFQGDPFTEACTQGGEMIGNGDAYLAFKRSFEGEGLWRGLPWSEAWGNPLSGFARLKVQGHNGVDEHALIALSPALPRVSVPGIFPNPTATAAPVSPPPASATPPPSETPLPTITPRPSPTLNPVHEAWLATFAEDPPAGHKAAAASSPVLPQQGGGFTTAYTVPWPLFVSPGIVGQVTILNAGNQPLRLRARVAQGGLLRPALCDGGESLYLAAAVTLRPCIKARTAGVSLLLEATAIAPPRIAIGVQMTGDVHQAKPAAYDGNLDQASELGLPVPYGVPAQTSLRLLLTNPGSSSALVEWSWVDGRGLDVIRRRQTLAPLDTQVVELGSSPIPEMPTQGQVRVRSLSDASGSATASGASVSAVLLLQATGSLGRLPALDGLAALPLKAVGQAAAGLRSGLMAVPLLQLAEDGTSELTVLDAAPGEGFTDLSLAILDANGLLDFDCARVNHGRVQRWNLGDLRFLPDGFRGAGIVSAVYWEHERPLPAGALPGPDLVAAVALRNRAGEQVVEAAAETLTRLPLGAVPDPVLPLLPPCPGVPTRVPPATHTVTPPPPTPQVTVSSLPPLPSSLPPSRTPLPPPSETPRPRLQPCYLPSVLAGADPWPLGLVLAVDVLAQDAAAGAAPAGPDGLPLAAARELGLAALDSLRTREDAAALVAYDVAAQLLRLGRPAQVAAALAALGPTDLRATARPDLGLAAAELAVRDLRDQGGVRRGAVLLFIDGATTEAELARAEARAARLRTAGLPIFALGFPSSHGGRPALARLTGSPAQVAWILPGEGGLVEAQEALDRWAADGWTATRSGEPPARR